MMEAFVITLREGVEAALVVGLALVYLRKTGRPDLARSVWAGVAAAAVLSIASGVALHATGFNPEGRAEGGVLLVSSGLVTWLVVWMWRHGKRMKQEMEERLARLSRGPRFGIFAFAFLMVLREGVEAVLMLAAVDFTTESILSAFGAAAGLGVALALGVALYKGAFRVDLRKFFAVTSAILLVFAFQLLASGLHEFAESGDLPSDETYMRVIGPLMTHNAIFVLAILVLPFLFMFRRAVASSGPMAANPAEDRKERARSRGERIAKVAFAAGAAAAILVLGASYVYTATDLMELPPPEAILEARPEIEIPVAAAADGRLHRFGVEADGLLLRFLVIQTGPERYATAMDACLICGDKGYVQRGERIYCRNCVAEIRPATIGEPGGCNPIPLRHERRAGALAFRLEDIKSYASYFRYGVEVECPGCGMKFKIEERGGVHEGKYYCKMAGCAKKLKGN